MFVATVNIPGYMPMDDDPPTFDAAREAWEYLLDEYAMSWNDVDLPGEPEDGLPEPLADVYQTVCRRMHAHRLTNQAGYVWAPMPGNGWDEPHDLGLSYSVSWVEEE